jgi:hypothetical protein
LVLIKKIRQPVKPESNKYRLKYLNMKCPEALITTFFTVNLVLLTQSIFRKERPLRASNTILLIVPVFNPIYKAQTGFRGFLFDFFEYNFP